MLRLTAGFSDSCYQPNRAQNYSCSGTTVGEKKEGQRQLPGALPGFTAHKDTSNKPLLVIAKVAVSQREKKHKTSLGLSVGKYMLVWCVLCRQVNRLADLISGEVVTGEASARIGCHIHFFPMQITVSRSPRFGMRPPERDTNQPDSVCVMFSARVAQQITVLLC